MEFNFHGQQVSSEWPLDVGAKWSAEQQLAAGQASKVQHIELCELRRNCRRSF